jgi:hypothetical protein
VYPNVFILPKKYTTMSEVTIGDVIRAFPLNAETNGPQYANLHFRFETCIFNKLTQKKIVCFRDVICPDDATLEMLNEVPVPMYKDRIRLKVLNLPSNVGKKAPPHMSGQLLHVIHRSE